MTSVERRLDWLAAVEAAFRETQQALARPSAESLDRVLPLLEQAVTELRTAPDVRPHLARLGGELRRTRALLDTAAGWHAGWASLLYTAACGYTANGRPSAPPPGHRLSLEA